MGVMSRKKEEEHGRRRAAVKSAARGNSDSEFINYELDKEQTAAYREWRDDFENVLNIVTELIEEGYRVTIKFDDYSSSCAVFLIPPAEGENDGYILTGRGSTAYRALSEAMYKHSDVFRGTWSVGAKPGSLDRDPDF